MHHLTDLSAFNNQRGLDTLLDTDQMVMNRTYGQQRRNGRMSGINSPVGKHDIVGSVINGLFRPAAKVIKSFAQAILSAGSVENHLEADCIKSFVTDMAKQIKLVKSLSGRKKDQVATANSLGLKKIGDVTVQPENAATLGKIQKISHLVEVQEA